MGKHAARNELGRTALAGLDSENRDRRTTHSIYDDIIRPVHGKIAAMLNGLSTANVLATLNARSFVCSRLRCPQGCYGTSTRILILLKVVSVRLLASSLSSSPLPPIRIPTLS
jgi:hypothetical protein